MLSRQKRWGGGEKGASATEPGSPVEQLRRHREAQEGADAESLEKRALLAMRRSDRRDALTLLVQAYGEPLYQYCHSVLRSRALADDVHQIVFLQAYQDLGTFTGERFRPWLYAIAHNRYQEGFTYEEMARICRERPATLQARVGAWRRSFFTRK